MKKTNILQIAASILMLGALLYGRPVNFPDNVNTQHGFPLIWGTHQLVTIAGPVDYWMVSLTSLAVDLMLWIALILVIPLIIENTSFENDK